MLSRVTESGEICEIIQYFGDKYKTAPYIYANVIKYGLGTENVFTWIDRDIDRQIKGIYLLYYDCIHFYTNDIMNYPIEPVMDFLHSHKHKVIMLQGSIGDRIEAGLTANYLSERNHVIDMDNIGLKDKEYRSQIGIREDISQIVDLLMADPEYINVYDRQVLSRQMYDRYDNGFSRYFVVKMDGKVVATCSTYGEVPGFAIIGGLIVHPDYRRRGLAEDVQNFACHVLANEGISRVCLINYLNTASLALHEKLGAYRVATLAKFIKK